jgi:predicted TIM-barrel fold metal-dependent hydrolase
MADIIDVWMQHPTPRFLAQPMFDSLRRWLGEGSIPEVPLSATLEQMDSAGIRIGLVSAWWGPTGPLIDNDEVASFVDAARGRLVGVASVDLYRPVAALRELGFRALRIVPWLWGLPPDDRRYYPLYAECVELDIPFCLQVGHTGPLRTSETGRPIPYLENVALEFPELKIVAGHIGFPWVREMISLARKFPNVYIDTSAYTAKRYPADFVEYLRGHGRKKVMFGTNYPMLDGTRCLQDLDSLGLDEDTRASFLHGNAARVFGIGE